MPALTKLVYLASPYTAKGNPALEIWRYKEALRYVGEALGKPYFVYSPIVYFHPVALFMEVSGEATAWQDYNKCMLVQAQELRVLKLPGWDKSLGVAEEITWAKKYKLPISYVSNDK